jgi:hypothetical protein
VDKNLLSTENVKSVGIIGLLSLILWASFSDQWAWKRDVVAEQQRTSEMKVERDKWMALALKGANLSEAIAGQLETTKNSGRQLLPLYSFKSGEATSFEGVSKRLDKVDSIINKK